MNAHQRKKQKKAVKSLTIKFAEFLNEMADDMESGKLTKEDFISEARKIKEFTHDQESWR